MIRVKRNSAISMHTLFSGYLHLEWSLRCLAKARLGNSCIFKQLQRVKVCPAFLVSLKKDVMINRPLPFGCQFYCILTFDYEVINGGSTSFIHRLWGIVQKK